jgi:hypothetical protein
MANIDDRWTSPGENGQRLPNARHGSGRRWRARYYDSSGRQHTQHFDRKIDAQRWLDSVTTAVGTGSYVDPNRSKVTLGVVAEQWMAGKINLKPTTWARYENALTVHVFPRWATVPFTAVEHGQIQAWLAELTASGQSGASVRKLHSVCRRCSSSPSVTSESPPTRREASTCRAPTRDVAATSMPDRSNY